VLPQYLEARVSFYAKSRQLPPTLNFDGHMPAIYEQGQGQEPKAEMRGRDCKMQWGHETVLYESTVTLF
jgi:hypothetical protein